MAFGAFRIRSFERFVVALEEGCTGAIEDARRIPAVPTQDLALILQEPPVRPHLEFPVLLGTTHIVEIHGELRHIQLGLVRNDVSAS